MANYNLRCPGEVQHAVIVLVTVLLLTRYFWILWNRCPPEALPLRLALGNCDDYVAKRAKWKPTTQKIFTIDLGFKSNTSIRFESKNKFPKWYFLRVRREIFEMWWKFIQNNLQITCHSAWTSISQAFWGATTQRAFKAWCCFEDMYPNVSICFLLESPTFAR